jgi:hypothetical protein
LGHNQQHLNKIVFKLISKVIFKFRDCQRSIYFRNTKYVLICIQISVRVLCFLHKNLPVRASIGLCMFCLSLTSSTQATSDSPGLFKGRNRKKRHFVFFIPGFIPLLLRRIMFYNTQHTTQNTLYDSTHLSHSCVTFPPLRTLNKRNTSQTYNITFACKRHVSPRLSCVHRSSDEFGRQIDSYRYNSTRSEREGNSHVTISLLRNGRGRGDTQCLYCVSFYFTVCVQYCHRGMRRK